ncbi:MAG: hypothetical protein FXF47_06880 [Candidatus Mcinerneyibacterium aminivorans]|uniref:Uncharacterized protein n=1 Tax=Candidatus Mcinerneyibacterium aminivorans TaxID=2703815 RepID=A0A5D0MHA8_9BACT|nr:MAG: hypothetical protein FXF47_06880 [Candidatus Mcinerneyibacterium aminivorans]
MAEKEFKDRVNKVWSKVKKISKEAYEKSKEYAIIAELKIKQNSLEKNKASLFKEMGEIVFDLIQEEEENIEKKEQILSKYRDIEDINEKINEVMLEIKRVKEEYNLKQEEIEKIEIKEEDEDDDEELEQDKDKEKE